MEARFGLSAFGHLDWLPWYLLSLVMLSGAVREALRAWHGGPRVRGMLNAAVMAAMFVSFVMIAFAVDRHVVWLHEMLVPWAWVLMLAGALLWLLLDGYDAVLALYSHYVLSRQRL